MKWDLLPTSSKKEGRNSSNGPLPKKQTREKKKVNTLFLANPQGVLAIGKQIIDPQKLFGKFNPEAAFLPGTL